MSELSQAPYERQLIAERMFAASAFMAPQHVLKVAGWLPPDRLRDEQIAKFWVGLKNHGNHMRAALDAQILSELMLWTNGTPSALNAKDYANRIIQEDYLYRMANTLPLLVKSIGKGDVEEAQRIIKRVSEDVPISNERIPDFGDVALEFIASLEDDPDSIPASIDTLNKGLGGWWRQIASVICARPSMGKTTFGWQEARYAGQAGKKVIMFSLEESRRTLVERVACSELRIPIRDARAGRLTIQQKKDLIVEANRLLELYQDRVVIDDRSDHTTGSVWQVVANEKPDLVVVDHLRLLKDTDRWHSEVKRQGFISQRLKEIAKEFNCHVMILAQLNRGLESRSDKRPNLSDLRDSGEIEENADLVLGLHRDDYYNKTNQPTNNSLTELNTLKFRNGPIIRFHLVFDKLGQKFMRAEPEKANISYETRAIRQR